MRKLKSLDRNQVISIQTPNETNTYQPVSYQTLINGAERMADKYQFILNKEEYQTDVHGNKIKMKFFFDDGMTDNGFQLSVLTSHDKSLSVRAAGGVYSYICWNLNMIGEVQLLHRHQGDVNEEVEIFLDKCFSSHQENQLLATKLEQDFNMVLLTKTDMAEIVGRAFVEEKLIGQTQLAIICNELENPSFVYNQANSMWTLYNHFTHAVKDEHPLTYMQKQQSVQTFFTNLQLEYIQ